MKKATSLVLIGLLVLWSVPAIAGPIGASARANTQCSATQAQGHAYDGDDMSASASMKGSTSSSESGSNDAHVWAEAAGDGGGKASASSDDHSASCEADGGSAGIFKIISEASEDADVATELNGQVLRDTSTGDLWFIGTMAEGDGLIPLSISMNDGILEVHPGMTAATNPPPTGLEPTGTIVTASLIPTDSGLEASLQAVAA